MPNIQRMRDLNGSEVRMTFTDGSSVLVTIIDVQDNLTDQVAFEVQEILSKSITRKQRLEVGKLYAVGLDDITSVERTTL